MLHLVGFLQPEPDSSFNHNSQPPVAILTYSTVQSPSWEANWFAASQEIPPFYGTRRFITAFTTVRHLSISWASSIQSISLYSTSWKSILILSSHQRLGLPNGSFPQISPPKSYIPLSSTQYALHVRQSHSSRFDHLNNTVWALQIIQLLIM